MPSETASSLVVLDLRQEESLVAEVSRFQPRAPHRSAQASLEILWNATPDPADEASYWKIGNRLAYVKKHDWYDDPERMESKKPAKLGKDKYGWSDFVELILVLLPPESTAIDVDPPARATNCGGRLALLWRRPDNRVTWQIEKLLRSLDLEVNRINEKFAERVAAHASTDSSRQLSVNELIVGPKIVARDMTGVAIGEGARADHNTGTGVRQSGYERQESNIWATGTFYLGLLLTVSAIVLVAFKVVPWTALPLTLGAVVVVFVAVSLVVLVHERRISDASFVKLMTQVLRLVPPFGKLVSEAKPEVGRGA